MNIFLVEDEYWALAELTELCRAYEPQHAVYAFSNGEEALQAAERVRPHLVLTDINMPVMDGLELSERLYRMDPSIKKIIVSVHDQFEYARLGMKYGVSDFLVKPVKKETLYHSIDQALRQLGEEARISDEWLLGALTRMLLTPEPPAHPKLAAFRDEAYYLVLAHVDGAEERRRAAPPDDGEVKRLFGLPPTAEAYRIEADGRRQVLLLRAADAPSERAIREGAEALLERLRLPSALVHIGIGMKPPGETPAEAFERLKRFVEEERRFGMPTVASIGERISDADLGGAWERVRILETHCRNGEWEKGRHALRSLLHELERKRVKRRQLELFVGDMMFSLKFKLHARNGGGVNLQHVQEDAAPLQHVCTYEDLYVCLQRKLERLYAPDRGKEGKDGNPKELIPLLLERIHKDYQEPLSLQQFAAEHYVSAGYLSRMFKAQTGLTFSEYVTEYRIRKAQELLSEGLDRLQDVSRLVGYEDPKYFGLQFKKLVGLSPLQYAKRASNGRQR
ncbi:response regulator transcription factor [Paenibacillus sp.]|uniref:response regulator transcription factor n=1 Tax=Paenibacillus sp. TaxID=58172 RepID=UPI002D4AB711|nr:response regulator [Paenibacillus sp.]HZG86314.1 response regulator [Paenibacillus sp.]